MVLHQLIAVGLAVGAGVAYLAGAPAPTAEQCFADHGFTDVTIYADGSVDIPTFTWADNNAGEMWDVRTDQAYDACEHLL